MFDLLLKNGMVLDGTGNAAVRADVGVTEGRIAACTVLPPATPAREVLDVSGLIVAPGFIDIHTHADIALLARPEHLPKIMQGVTTEVFTNCGLGFAPVTPDALMQQRDTLLGLFGDAAEVRWDWRTTDSFLQQYAAQGIATNIAYLLPHGAIRVSVMGMAMRPADAAERAAMERMVAEGIEQGAWGLSTGLWYAPMSHADHAELVALCRRAGFFATHQRDYREHLFTATAETISLAEEAGVPVQLSHLQLNGAVNKGRAPEMLQFLDDARRRGVDITWDTYPYTAGSTLVHALLPAWATEGGSEATLRRLADSDVRERIEREIAPKMEWEKVILAGAQSAVNRRVEGLPFTTIAAQRGMTVAQYVCRLLVEDALQACFIVYQMDEGDVQTILQHPAQMVGSDGLHLTGKTHPRLYGTFPRVLGHYVRETKTLALAEAVRKMTSAPAERLGLPGRGRIASGYAADLVCFDPAAIADTATYDDPLRYPEGIPHVFVNGTAAKRDNLPTQARAGQVLRRS
jgi:N-acyl-D-amino-acid deacylase